MLVNQTDNGPLFERYQNENRHCIGDINGKLFLAVIMSQFHYWHASMKQAFSLLFVISFLNALNQHDLDHPVEQN